MNPDTIPRVVFEFSRARILYPKPEPKHAVLIRIPRTEDGRELPAFIKPRTGGLQVFYGDFYGLVDAEGIVRRGSARAQWEAMHVMVKPGFWVQTATPWGYQVTTTSRIVTPTPSESGETAREQDDVMNPGDWIVRQPGGKLQYIRDAKYKTFYFTHAEAQERGLHRMSPEEFTAWAVGRARSLIV